MNLPWNKTRPDLDELKEYLFTLPVNVSFICENHYKGYGNNTDLGKNKGCCDKCNNAAVMQHRLHILKRNM